VLEPIERGAAGVDKRTAVRIALPADEDASRTFGRTRHQEAGTAADVGIGDVRVSREHVRVSRRIGGAPTMTVLAHTNPVQYCETRAGGGRRLLTKGQVCELVDGDEVRLVVEEHVRAEGSSERFAGNPCAYRVELYRKGVRLSAERRAGSDLKQFPR